MIDGREPERADIRPGARVLRPRAARTRTARARGPPGHVPACAAAYQLALGIDSVARDAEGFLWRTSSQIDEGRSWLWLEDDVILFKAEASAWTPSAVQLQQVWVDPEARGHGYAQRGLADLCRLLLETTPAVTLFVRRENTAAIRLYHAVGMRRVLEYRSILF